jgi:hypothetical protein
MHRLALNVSFFDFCSQETVLIVDGDTETTIAIAQQLVVLGCRVVIWGSSDDAVKSGLWDGSVE